MRGLSPRTNEVIKYMKQLLSGFSRHKQFEI